MTNDGRTDVRSSDDNLDLGKTAQEEKLKVVVRVRPLQKGEEHWNTQDGPDSCDEETESQGKTSLRIQASCAREASYKVSAAVLTHRICCVWNVEWTASTVEQHRSMGEEHASEDPDRRCSF